MDTSTGRNIFPENYFRLPFSETGPDCYREKKDLSLKTALSFLQLFLLAATSFYFRIFTDYGFDRLLIAFSVLLPVYYVLPVKYRIPALVLFFVGFITYAIGPVSSAFYVLSSVFILFIIRKPRSFIIYLILFLFVAVLALLRLEIFYFPRLIFAIPYIGAAFMFRGILLFYESKHNYLTSGFWLDIAYFFFPANLCFLLFGVIDPVKFSKSFVGLKAFNTGLKRIYTGFTLVILHRVILNLFPITFEDVNDLKSLVHYAVINYLFVLNATGILLAGIGTLGLCGFELPPIFGNFLIVTSFTEMWRKINSYWRDFIIRVFYYPLFFKFRKLSKLPRVLLSVNIAFFLSWMLHDYQLFWISGKIDLKFTGFLFWMIFGNLVAYAVYKEFTLGTPPKRNLITRTLSAVGIFITCCFLWLLWRSENLNEFVYLLSYSRHSVSVTYLLFALGALIIICGLYLYLEDVLKEKAKTMIDLALTIIIPLFFAVLTLSSFSFFEKQFPQLKRSLALFSQPKLNDEENFTRDEGYYENVIASGKSRPWEIKLKGEMAWGNSKGATRRTGDILLREFIPSTTTTIGNFTLKINSDGLRDEEYSFEKKPNTFRMGILGGSIECGYGVEKENVFESLVENDLDSIYSDEKIEIINFAGLGNMLLQNIETTKKKVIPYKPDVLFYFSHPSEYRHIARNFTRLVLNGVDLKYDFLKEIKASSGVTQNMKRQEITLRLLPYSASIVKWGYAQIAEDCAKNGIKPVWVYLPTPNDDDPNFNYKKISQLAEQNGFVIINLSEVYKGYSFEQIRVSETDFHPSVLGHHLISEMFLKKLLENKKEIGLP